MFYKNYKKLLLIKIVSLFLLTIFTLSTINYLNKKNINSQLKKYLDSNIILNNFNGTILVAKNNKILINKVYGMENLEINKKNTFDTKFNIASLTKQFTAAAILQLQEKQLLNINDSINTYINNFPYGNEITIHQLLTHTSGLPCDIEDIISAEEIALTLDETILSINNIDFELKSKPGEKYHYSNFGYIILGKIIELTSGKSYEEYLKNNIFIPLNMNNTGIGYDRKITSNLAIGYTTDNKNYINNDFYDCSINLFASGAIYSTANDMYKWDRALYTETILNKSSIDLMFTSYKSNYSYGWNVFPNKEEIYYHNGNALGFSSKIIRLVDDNSVIIILSNSDNVSICDNLANNLFNILINKKSI